MRLEGVSVPVEAALKVLLLCALGLGALWAERRGLPKRASARLKWAVVAFGFFTWLNWGAFHTDGSFVHSWDQVHYFVNSKYYSELRHDGLYLATIAALTERYGDYKPPERVRDLRINRIVNYSELAAHQRQVRSRFSDARWKSFKEDVVHLGLPSRVFLDRGYNAPPPLTAIAQSVTSHLPVRYSTMFALGVLDAACVLGALVLIGLTYAPGTAVLCSLLLGTSFLSRFYWTGGAFARHDWFLAVVGAVCLLKRERYLGAGGALGYAIAVRVFPVLFLVPLAAWFLGRLRAQRVAVLQFSAGTALSAGTLLAAGLWFGGEAAYAAAYDKLVVHGSVPVGNATGLRAVLSVSIDGLLGNLTHPVELYEFDVMDRALSEIGRQRAGWMFGASALALLFSWLLGCRARNASEAAVLGLVPVALLTSLSCYYWILLVMLPLVDARRGFYLGIAANLAMFSCGLLALAAPSLGWVTRFSPMAVFVPCGVVLILSLLVWSWPLMRRKAELHAVANADRPA